MPAVAGTHAPGRGEGAEGLRRWLVRRYDHCSQLLSWVEGSKVASTIDSRLLMFDRLKQDNL